jgi:LytS/YehU family sensor histidine kinase
VDAAVAARAELPPGIVLSLVENALEHGLSPALAGGQLQIRLAGAPGGGWCLEVADDGVGLAAGWREGLGLGNSRARLAHAFGARALLALQARPAGGTLAILQVEERDGAAV